MVVCDSNRKLESCHSDKWFTGVVKGGLECKNNLNPLSTNS